MENKIIGIKQVLEMLENGMTRPEIGKHYGITKTELTQLFKHKDLFGKKTKPKPTFTIVDDEANRVTLVDAPQDEAPFEMGTDLVEGPMAKEIVERSVATPSWEA